MPLVVFAGRLRKSVALDAASPAIAAGGAGELRIVVLDCLMVGATARRHEPGHYRMCASYVENTKART